VFKPVKAERKTIMAKKELNTEELAELRESPYVASIISGRINFTPEFKRAAYQQLMDGKPMRTIFKEHGIDPEILGDKRIWGFAHKLRTNADRDEGFADLRCHNSRKPAKETREQTLAARVEQLEHELAYTRQEVEFLKKIRTADMEARKSWESRQRRK
jgi:transposase-like protein